MLSTFVGPLAWAVGDGTAVATTVTKTGLLTSTAASGKWAMPGNFFTAPGQMLRIRASGRISTPAAVMGNPIFTFDIGSVAVATSPAFVSQASQTNVTWILDWHLTLRTVGDGTLATFMHVGELRSVLVSSSVLVNMIPPTAPVIGTGFDASAAATATLSLTWSNATVGNTIQLHQYLIESTV